jgi:hypothetical protein
MTPEARLDRLERSIRRWRLGALAIAISKLRHELGSPPTNFCGSPNEVFKTGFSDYEQQRRVKHSVE